MLEKTMGCPHTFRYRREELARQKNKIITDEEVLQSFIRESSPDGITGQYLQLSQIAAIVPNTGVLAVHGGLTPMNIGRIPDMHDTDQPIDDIRIWIREFNHWHKKQILSWMQAKPEFSSVPANTALDECALPIPNKPQSIITANMLGKNRQFTEVPSVVSQYLQRNNIHVILTGHQPIGDYPVILRASHSLFINGDTGYAKFNASNPNQDDTRGNTAHALEIAASPQLAQIAIKATLSDDTHVANKLAVNGDSIVGDDYIGRITADNRLVQCRLANGDYRLVHQHGHQVSYSVTTRLALERMFDIHQPKLVMHY
jgi:hypothetical protein